MMHAGILWDGFYKIQRQLGPDLKNKINTLGNTKEYRQKVEKTEKPDRIIYQELSVFTQILAKR